MAQSPLELYAEAYRLHYQEGDLSQAVALYNEIIAAFPDSQECAYAVVQLQKIDSEKISRKAARSQATIHPLLIIVTIISTLTLIAVAAGGTLFMGLIRQEKTTQTLVSRALSKMALGQEQEALTLLKSAQVRARFADIAPFALAADIFIDQGEYEQALAMYKEYARRFPKSPLPTDQIRKITSQTRAPKPVPQVEEEPALADTPAGQSQPRATPARKAAPKLTSPRPEKPVKMLVKDSISFF